MNRSQGGRWLEVGAGRDGMFSILDSGCLRRLTQEMHGPDRQFPTLWVFLGSGAKTAALRELFAANKIGRTRSDGGITLRSDVASWSSDRPIWFVDSDPSHPPVVRHGQQPWQNTPIKWPAQSARQVQTLIFSRLLFPFADVVCLFADDFPFGENVVSFLANYRAVAAVSQLRPRLIIVHNPDMAGAKVPRDWSNMSQFAETFAEMVVVEWAPDGSHSPRDLQQALNVHSAKVQRLRQEHMAKLSATHLCEFFELATRHFTQVCDQPFDMVNACRGAEEIPGDLGLRVADFYKTCVAVGLSDVDATRSIATALIMDHYRPLMPR